MIVRLRLGRGRKVRQQNDALNRVLEGLAVLLQPAVLAAFALAGWRFGVDLGVTRAFPFSNGPWSHWQPWFAGAVGLLFAIIIMNRYARAGSLTAAVPAQGSATERIHLTSTQ